MRPIPVPNSLGSISKFSKFSVRDFFGPASGFCRDVFFPPLKFGHSIRNQDGFGRKMGPKTSKQEEGASFEAK